MAENLFIIIPVQQYARFKIYVIYGHYQAMKV